MICPKCKEEILPEDNKYMVACERPYFNVYMHRGCYDLIKNSLVEYVTTNLSAFLEIWNNKTKKISHNIQ